MWKRRSAKTVFCGGAAIRPGLSSEGVLPAEAGEAVEVGVVEMEFCLVLDGECGDVGVGDEVAADASRGHHVAEYHQVLPPPPPPDSAP